MIFRPCPYGYTPRGPGDPHSKHYLTTTESWVMATVCCTVTDVAPQFALSPQLLAAELMDGLRHRFQKMCLEGWLQPRPVDRPSYLVFVCFLIGR